MLLRRKKKMDKKEKLNHINKTYEMIADLRVSDITDEEIYLALDKLRSILFDVLNMLKSNYHPMVLKDGNK